MGCCKVDTRKNPRDYQLKRKDLVRILKDHPSIASDTISIDGEEYDLSSISDTYNESVTVPPEENLESARPYLLYKLFVGDSITVTCLNYEFISKVAEEYEIMSLVKLCSKFETNNNRSRSLRKCCCIGFNITAIFYNLGIIGKILWSLWDLSGAAVTTAFFLNIIVLLATMGINYMMNKVVIFLFVLMPLMFYSAYFSNIILIPLVQVFKFTLFRQDTIFSHHQYLIMLIFRVTKWGQNIRRQLFFHMNRLYNIIIGIFLFVFIIFFVVQAKIFVAADLIKYFIMVFAVYIPPIKYFVLLFLYVIHSVLSCFPICRERFTAFMEFDDPFISSMYTRRLYWLELYKYLFPGKNKDVKDSSIELTEDRVKGDVDPESNVEEGEQQENTVKKQKLWKLIGNFILCKAMFSLYILIAAICFMVSERKTAEITSSQVAAIVIAFIIVIIPLSSTIKMPFFFIKRTFKTRHTDQQLFRLYHETIKTKKYLKYVNNYLSWHTSYIVLRFISFIINLIIVILVIAALVVGVSYIPIDEINDAIKTPLVNPQTKLLSTYDNSINDPLHHLVVNPICYTQPKGLSMQHVVTLSRVPYAKTLEDRDYTMTEFFGPDWAKTISFNDSIPFPDPITGAYMQHIYFNDSKLVVFSIRGTANTIDALVDLELWFGSVILDVIKPILPFVNIYTDDSGNSFLGKLMSLPRLTFRQFSLVDGYVNAFHNYIKSVPIEDDQDVIITGHSLGGGMSKLLAYITGYTCVAVSGPGITAVKGLYVPAKDDIQMTFIDVSPMQDFVAMVDISTGSKFEVPCESGMFGCHSIYRTLCQIASMCGTIDQHMDYCLSKFDESTVERMKRLSQPFNISNPSQTP